jgi:hypothetical protein
LWEKWGFWALEKVAYGGSPRQAREAAAAPVGGVAPLVSLQSFGRWEGGNQTTSFFLSYCEALKILYEAWYKTILIDNLMFTSLHPKRTEE